MHLTVRRSVRVGVHGHIDIGTERERDPPVRHRQAGIELRRALERPDRRFVIEGEDQLHSLVEIRLRLSVSGRHAVVQRSEASIEGDR